MIGSIGAQVTLAAFELIIIIFIRRNHWSAGRIGAGVDAFATADASGLIDYPDVAEGAIGPKGFGRARFYTGRINALSALRNRHIIRVGFKRILDDLYSCQ